jgi:hypothetical protein
MIELSPDDFRAVMAEARLAPSVHNVQPTRWRLSGGTIQLLGDQTRSIPIADPAGRDWRLSHGAAFEGLSLAMARRGLSVEPELFAADWSANGGGPLLLIASAKVVQGPTSDLHRTVAARASWRGGFQPIDAETDAHLDRLAAAHPDLYLIRARDDIASAARLADKAGMHFLRDRAHRRELLQWMRLSRNHPQFERDGLNATAMNMGAVEAWGAGLVLGPLFGPLDRMGIAAQLTSEYAKTATAAAVALFHRETGEDPFHSGRAFYRVWLAMESAGVKGAPMSVLADWPEARSALHERCGIGAHRFIVSAFRIGRPAIPPAIGHARLSVDELIV